MIAAPSRSDAGSTPLPNCLAPSRFRRGQGYSSSRVWVTRTLRFLAWILRSSLSSHGLTTSPATGMLLSGALRRQKACLGMAGWRLASVIPLCCEQCAVSSTRMIDSRVNPRRRVRQILTGQRPARQITEG